MARQPNYLYSGNTGSPWGQFASALGQSLFGDPAEIRARDSADAENELRQLQLEKTHLDIDAARKTAEENARWDAMFNGTDQGGGAAAPQTPLGTIFTTAAGGPQADMPPVTPAGPIEPVMEAPLPEITGQRGATGMLQAPPSTIGNVFQPPAPPSLNGRLPGEPSQAGPGSPAQSVAYNPAGEGPAVNPMGDGYNAAPVSIGGPFNMDEYLQYLAQRESSGGKNLQNPNSTAAGRYGFTNGTWADQGGQGSALNASPDEEDQRIRQFTMQNYNALKRTLGREPTYADLYAAHHFGATGGARLIQAGIDTPIEQAISSAALAANPYLKGQSVGDWFMQANKDFPGQQWDGGLPTETAPPATMEAGAPPPDPMMEAGAPDAGTQALQAAFVPPQDDGLDIQTAAAGGGLPMSTPSSQEGAAGYALDPSTVQTAQDATEPIPQGGAQPGLAPHEVPQPGEVQQPVQPVTLQDMVNSLSPQEKAVIQASPDKRKAFIDIMQAKIKHGAGGDGSFLGDTKDERAYGAIRAYQRAVVNGEQVTPEMKQDYDTAVTIVSSKYKLQQSTDPKTGNPIVVMVKQNIPMLQGFVDPYGDSGGAAPQDGGVPVDPSNVSLDQEGNISGFTTTPVMGGKVGPIPPEAAGKIAALKSSEADIKIAKDAYFPKGVYDRVTAANIYTGAGRDAYQALTRSVEGVLRTMSGAATPDPEVVRYLQTMFGPSVWDSDAGALRKITALDEWRKGMLELASRGRGLPGQEMSGDEIKAAANSSFGASAPAADPAAPAGAAPVGGAAPATVNWVIGPDGKLVKGQ